MQVEVIRKMEKEGHQSLPVIKHDPLGLGHPAVTLSSEASDTQQSGQLCIHCLGILFIN
jgi:hypothetical protein